MCRRQSCIHFTLMTSDRWSDLHWLFLLLRFRNIPKSARTIFSWWHGLHILSDFNPNQHLGKMLDKHVWPPEAPTSKQTPQRSFRGLVEAALRWVRAVSGAEAAQRCTDSCFLGWSVSIFTPFISFPLWRQCLKNKVAWFWDHQSLFYVPQCNEGCIKAHLHMGKAYLALKKYNEVSIITTFCM